MNEWMVHVKTEWKLLFRGTFLLLLVMASAGLWLIIYLMNKDAVNTYVLLQQFGFLFSGPLSIGAMLAGVYGAHRDHGLKVDRLLASLPYRSGRMLITRFFVLALPFVVVNMAASISMLGIKWSYSHHGEPAIGYPLMVLTMVSFGMLYAVALGWAVGVIIRGRVSYFIGFLFWFAHVYGGFLVLNSILPQSFYALPNFMLLDYKSMGVMDEVWGFVRDSSLWLHRAFYLMLTSLILVLLVWVMKKRRKERVSRSWVYGLIILCLVATVSMAISYASVRGAHIEAYSKWESAVKTQLAKAPPEPASYTIANYDLTVRYVDKDASLELQALLDIQALEDSQALDRLEMTLNPAFVVEKVIVNSMQEKFTQEGYGVTIALGKSLTQNEHVKVELTYTGKMEDWRLIYPYGQAAQKLVLTYKASSSQVYLPGAAGWYPLPGKHNLVEGNDNPRYLNKESKWLDSYPAVSPSNYKVTTDFPQSLTLLSNLDKTSVAQSEGRQRLTFEGHEVDGLALIAGPLQEIRASDSSIVKGIFSQWMDGAHAKAFMTMADANVQQINGLLGVEPFPMTLLPFEPSNGKDGQNLGGVITIHANMINERNLYVEASDRFNQQYLELITKSEFQQSHWLTEALSAYIRSGRKEKPVQISTTNGPVGKQLETYMNEHPKEEVEQMLRGMYKMLVDQPDQSLDMNKILSNGGAKIAEIVAAH